MLPPKLILAPIDFSDSSRAALDVAADFATRFGAELLLVHVQPAIEDLPKSVSIFTDGEYDQSLNDAAAKRLADLASTTPWRRKMWKARTEIGTANDTLGWSWCAAREHNHADLIIIATHGMTGWQRKIAFGSVAEKVVKQASCPVLVLRANALEEDARVARRRSLRLLLRRINTRLTNTQARSESAASGAKALPLAEGFGGAEAPPFRRAWLAKASRRDYTPTSANSSQSERKFSYQVSVKTPTRYSAVRPAMAMRAGLISPQVRTDVPPERCSSNSTHWCRVMPRARSIQPSSRPWRQLTIRWSMTTFTGLRISISILLPILQGSPCCQCMRP